MEIFKCSDITTLENKITQPHICIQLHFLASLVAQLVKNLPAIWETWVRSPGRSPGEENGNALQYSCLENSMDGGACWATVCGVSKSRTRLSDFTFTFNQELENLTCQMSQG